MYFPALVVALLCLSHWSSACDVEDSGVTDEIREAILATHNQLRAKVAKGEEGDLPKASNMQELVWDDNLAKASQAWAEKCVYEHDNSEDRGGDGHTGQNIATESKGDETPDWDKIINMWYGEVKDFSADGVASYEFVKETGHFTQVIWAETNKIGCGYVRHSDNGQKTHLYGCNYAPGGNMAGAAIYKEGEPCSECGGCGSIDGLCAAGGGNRKKRDTEDAKKETEEDLEEKEKKKAAAEYLYE